MLKNYLKIALRNLRKYKFISFINLFGLTVGLTCCLLIVTYILNELSYDRFNENASRIYRVTRSFNTADGIENLHLSAVAPPFGPLLKNDFPDIQKMTRLLNNGSTSLRYEEKLFLEKNAFFADENFFDFFPTTITRGNAKTALAEPNCVMISEEIAKKYFGRNDPVNQMVKIDNALNLKVTGLFKLLPSNAHFHPELLISFSTLNDSTVYGRKQLETNFGNNAFYTYLMFPENYPVAKIESRFPAFLDKHYHFPNEPAGFKGSTATKLYLQKLTDIHLRSHLDDEIEPNGDIKRVYIFSAIALFVLLIACINYMNLSTARSALRAREIGVRKVAGAQRKEIIAQFLSESIFLAAIALIFALLLTWAILPLVNSLLHQSFSIKNLLQAPVIISILLLPFVVGLLSGIYPALFMSSFNPVSVLKGSFKIGKGNISFRQVLVVAQFSISIILIIATMVVFQQLRYMQNASLGYNKDHLVTLPYTSALNNKYESFRSELFRNPNIKNFGRSSRIPTGRLLDDMGASILSGDSLKPINADLKYITIDYDFIPTYGINMAAGRNFSRDFSTDSANFIINEAAVSMLNWKTPTNAIGKDIAYGGVRGKIIGVTNDFHFESMHQKIIPLIMIRNFGFGNLTIKISGNNIPATIKYIDDTWKKYLPETPFQYNFFDEKFAALYSSEQQQGNIFTVFSCIAIFIACLGLFGLSAFAITQRIKEIGIRKVLGASVTQITTMMSKDFLKLVAIAAVIAFPVAWYAMYQWLQDFAYRIHLAWWIFLAAGIAATLIAFITISFQAVKAGLSNPAKAIRAE
ncbi:MAG: ABC transporter permease [Bacteroidetes bacterium]|nr:ABC transporter permease [Bacteroidota bacterium]